MVLNFEQMMPKIMGVLHLIYSQDRLGYSINGTQQFRYCR